MKQTKTITVQDDSIDSIEVKMTISEFVEFRNFINKNHNGKVIRKGLNGIMETFGCSRNMAFKIAHSEWFAPCKIQMGKHIVFDANKAWALAKEVGY